MDTCTQLLITKAKWKHEDKKYRVTFCLSSECDYPAKLCLYKFQNEIQKDKIYEVMQ